MMRSTILCNILMDIYEVQELDIPDFLYSFIATKKTLKDFSQKEFDELLWLPLFEISIQNSINSRSIHKNKWGLFNSIYIHKELINDLIGIYQELLKRVIDKESLLYKVNDTIQIESINFWIYKDRIVNILIANNINFLKERVSKYFKSFWDQEQYSDALNVAISTFLSKLNDFDAMKGYDIKTYVSLFIDSDIKDHRHKDNLIKYPKELYILKNILDSLKESDNTYSVYGYKKLLFEVIWNIHDISMSTILNLWDLYFYILGYGSVTKNQFIQQFYKKDFNKSSCFQDEKDISIFQKHFLEFIKENNKPEYLLSRINKIAETLDIMDMGMDSLDREIWNEDDTTLLWDTISQHGLSNFEILIYQRSNMEVMDREIRLEKTPNIKFSLLERIIAWACINEYFTFKEFRDLLREYGIVKWVNEKYVDNFHKYLSLFKFKDKSNWYIYDSWKLDALIDEQIGDILWFSTEYAWRTVKEVEKKFNEFYKPHGIFFTRYDTRYHGKTKTFRDIGKEDTNMDDDKNEYVPPENFSDSYQSLVKKD